MTDRIHIELAWTMGMDYSKELKILKLSQLSF